MEPDGSLPHLQVPTTCPYPEPVQSSPCPPIPLPENPSQYYLPIYAWVFHVVSFPQVSPPVVDIMFIIILESFSPKTGGRGMRFFGFGA